MLHISEFVWTVRSSVLVVFNNFLLIDATDRGKISSDRKRLFFTVNQYLSFFANIPLSEPPFFRATLPIQYSTISSFVKYELDIYVYVFVGGLFSVVFFFDN